MLMDSPSFMDFKNQASFFFREKIKTARLVLTDVTPAQLMTEEATDGNPWPPRTPIMATIARAAFEIDDYWRIVDVLRKRLLKFEVKDWRTSYKALILLEHLLTHGPKSFFEEFQDTKEIIKNMSSFQHVDDNRFDWGLRVRNLSERVLKLLENSILLRDERSRARSLTRGIEGFGSFNQLSYFEEQEEGLKNSSFKIYGRSKSECKSNISANEKQNHKNTKMENSIYVREDHPFCEHEFRTSTESLLFSVE